MTSMLDYTQDPNTVGSPFSYIRPGTVFMTMDGRKVTVISIGDSGIWTLQGHFKWDDLHEVICR